MNHIKSINKAKLLSAAQTFSVKFNNEVPGREKHRFRVRCTFPISSSISFFYEFLYVSNSHFETIIFRKAH